MKRKGIRLSSASGFSVFLAIAVFALMALLTVVLGAGVYRSVAARAENNHSLRSAITYVTGKLRSMGESGEARIEQTEVGSSLVLSEQIEGEWYETRIYAHGGRLYEVFSERGMVFEPECGQAIAKLDDFRAEMAGERLIRLRATVDGTEYAVHVALPE
ncbi:MAG: DUF4860 domain-containing protein [Clostridiales bacterium]|nr:DUF4860 domain-containing protein [Clostridiales bacterium]